MQPTLESVPNCDSSMQPPTETVPNCDGLMQVSNQNFPTKQGPGIHKQSNNDERDCSNNQTMTNENGPTRTFQPTPNKITTIHQFYQTSSHFSLRHFLGSSGRIRLGTRQTPAKQTDIKQAFPSVSTGNAQGND